MPAPNHQEADSLRGRQQFDDEWAAFLAAHRFLVGLSIDGPPHLHDACRKTKSGAGGYDLAVAALRRLQRCGAEYNLLAVVNAVTAPHPVEVYRHLTRDLGAAFVQFIPVVERRTAGLAAGAVAHPQTTDPAAAVTESSVSGEDYGRFIVGVFDQWVRNDVGRIFVQTFDEALAAWVGERPRLCVMAPTCGAGLAIEQDGDVYPCDHYVFDDLRLGNVIRDDLARLVDGKRQRAFAMAKADLPRPCRPCPWRFVCNGGCPKHRFAGGDGERRNHLCPGYRAMFSHMAPYMRFMARQLELRRPPAEVMRAAPELALRSKAPPVD